MTAAIDRQGLADAKRVVIKLGTSVLFLEDGRLAVSRVNALAESIAALWRAGREVVVVASGAVALGAELLGARDTSATRALARVCAAVGQPRLMSVYGEAFQRADVQYAQVLLTSHDFMNGAQSSNMAGAFGDLLRLGVQPLVNENDFVSEWCADPLFTENDMLAALVARMTGADALLLLSDVDGVYESDPSTTPGARLVSVVCDDYPVQAALAQTSSRGRGGITRKLEAARCAASAGAAVVIASGQVPEIIEAVFRGAPAGSLIVAGAVE